LVKQDKRELGKVGKERGAGPTTIGRRVGTATGARRIGVPKP
jgi:hypothetical protein